MGEIADDPRRAAITGFNAASPFNAFFGFAVGAIGDGSATLNINVRPEAINHAGTLHAGVTAALLDTAAGYAAATVAGNVVTSGLTIAYLAAARGAAFTARADVVRAGKRQIFVEARLYGTDRETLVATASAILLPV